MGVLYKVKRGRVSARQVPECITQPAQIVSRLWVGPGLFQRNDYKSLRPVLSSFTIFAIFVKLGIEFTFSILNISSVI